MDDKDYKYSLKYDLISKHEAEEHIKAFTLNDEKYLKRNYDKRNPDLRLPDQRNLKHQRIVRKVISSSREKEISKILDKNIFKINLFLAIKVLNYSNEDFYNYSGLKEQSISKIFNKKCNPKLSTIFSICYALRISPSLLFMSEDTIKYNLDDENQDYSNYLATKVKSCNYNLETIEKMKKCNTQAEQRKLAAIINQKVFLDSDELRVRTVNSVFIGAVLGAYHYGKDGYFVGIDLGRSLCWEINYTIPEKVEILNSL